ncbi:MAG: acetyl-CoA hydrolase/transferase family protein [Syntrophales bacterium]
MDWKEHYKRKVISFEEAAKKIKSGDFVGTGLALGSCSPDMFHAILDRWADLEGVQIGDSLPIAASKLYDQGYMSKIDGHINYNPCFGSTFSRKINESRLADFYPTAACDSGEKMAAWSDVYISMVTPPNSRGFVSLGLNNFYTMDAIRKGRASGKLRVVIGEVNDQMPMTFGNNWMHISEFDFFVEKSSKIAVLGRPAPGEKEKKIAEYVLGLIKDGDTIQMGIGPIPEAVISGLDGKHDLGVHTEMFPIGLPQLEEKGIVTNARKPYHKGVTVATFCLGDPGMYDHVTDNPNCEFHPVSYTNSPLFIAQHPNLVAMNMALLVDFSGQICSEGLGHRMITGSGGQLDFMIGSYYSKGGRGITLIYSSRTLKNGSLASAIVPEFPPGTPITVPRTFAQYVVTEYGIADLRFKSRRQRAEALINIAHPDLRGELRSAMRKNFYSSDRC